VCPVKIDIHQQLYQWRQVLIKKGYASSGKKAGISVMAFTLSRPRVFRFAGKIMNWILKNIPSIINNKMNVWYKQREMPAPPRETFSDWYRKSKGGNEK
jgi:L-lactate dehydrogenase complex protein LldF